MSDVFEHAPSKWWGRVLSLVLVVLLLTPVASSAQLAVSLRAGTRGGGVDLTFPIRSTFNVRVGGTYFTYSTDGTDVIEGTRVGWEGESDLFFLNALADWHPLGNAFRFTGGAVFNGLEANGSFQPEENIRVGGNTYTPSEVGRVDAIVDFDRSVAPYLGLGFGNPARGGRVDFLFDIGVIYQGEPSVDLNATEMLTPTEEEASKIEENISWARWYPMVSIGVSARLF